MMRLLLTCLSTVAVLGCVAVEIALGAQGDDPDWPCIQRKVPELSLGQIWTGEPMPASAPDWQKDAAVSSLLGEVALRWVPLPDAEQRIRQFAQGLPDGERQARMLVFVQGLFDRMNRERSQVISGIARYAGRQREMASALRQEASAIDDLRAKPGTDANALALRSDRLVFETRVFQERVQSLTFVCEVPTIMEQRLYALTKVVAETLRQK